MNYGKPRSLVLIYRSARPGGKLISKVRQLFYLAQKFLSEEGQVETIDRYTDVGGIAKTLRMHG